MNEVIYVALFCSFIYLIWLCATYIPRIYNEIILYKRFRVILKLIDKGQFSDICKSYDFGNFSLVVTDDKNTSDTIFFRLGKDIKIFGNEYELSFRQQYIFKPLRNIQKRLREIGYYYYASLVSSKNSKQKFKFLK